MDIIDEYDKREKVHNETRAEDNEEKYVIPVAIGETTLNLTFTASTEEYYWCAVKTVNDSIKKYQESYSDASIELILGAIAIENVYRNQTNN